MRFLGINAIFHDPAAALVVDGGFRVEPVDWGGYAKALMTGADLDRGWTEDELAAWLDAFQARTGLPVIVNTSLNTAGRPMVDDPRDALECFGSAPVDVLAIGPYLVRRGEVFAA